MRPLPLLGGALLAAYLAVKRRSLGRLELAAGALVAAVCALVGLEVVPVPDVVGLVERVGKTLGPYTYLAVGALAFLETGAFVGLLAPGETAIIVGGVVAGQGEISPILLVAIVWSCAVAGDVTSFLLGRRLGREFMLRHGHRVKITEERLEQVERFLERRGGITILTGRFVGLVRAVAPFVAGSARMPLARFLPYDVLGAGLWSALFVTLGYAFWRSLDQVEQYVGRGLLVFSGLVGLVVLGVAVHRLREDPEARRRLGEWAAERPWLRPLIPLAQRAWGPVQFVYERLTPGHLGLELTTLLALTAVGGFAFFVLADALHVGRALLPGDEGMLETARRLGSAPVERAVSHLTDLGSAPVMTVLTALTAVWAIVRRRHWLDAAALAAGTTLTHIAVHFAKLAEARPRPLDEVAAGSYAFPSGHAANAVGLIACAVVLYRVETRLGTRLTTVAVAGAGTILVALTRVYLREHYLSDVMGGIALAGAIFSACGAVAVVVAYVRHNGPRS